MQEIITHVAFRVDQSVGRDVGKNVIIGFNFPVGLQLLEISAPLWKILPVAEISTVSSNSLSHLTSTWSIISLGVLPSLSIFEGNFEVRDIVRCGTDTIILYVLVLQEIRKP